jgi:beta-fructofuranosidase
MLSKLLLAATLLPAAFAQDASTSAASSVIPAASVATSSASTEPTLVGTPSAPSPTSESNVPTGTPVPGNYTGAYRPQVHFSPPAGFMNDPNGMFVDDNGTWHLYYQCE